MSLHQSVGTEAFENERQIVERLREGRRRIGEELAKVIVGQRDVIDQLLIALFAGGHCLITGAPGLAKTLLVKSIAQIFHLKFQRIQFTPDLMPADITGTEILAGDRRRPAEDGVRQGADLRQRDAGRRDQPHTPEDPGGSARGHAGAPGDCRR